MGVFFVILIVLLIVPIAVLVDLVIGEHEVGQFGSYRVKKKKEK